MYKVLDDVLNGPSELQLIEMLIETRATYLDCDASLYWVVWHSYDWQSCVDCYIHCPTRHTSHKCNIRWSKWPEHLHVQQFGTCMVTWFKPSFLIRQEQLTSNALALYNSISNKSIMICTNVSDHLFLTIIFWHNHKQNNLSRYANNFSLRDDTLSKPHLPVA